MRVRPRVHQRRVFICGLALFLGLATALWQGGGASAAPHAQEASGTDAVRLKLPRGVSLELPRNWTILSKDERVALNEAMKVGAGELEQALIASELSFAAKLIDAEGRTLAFLNVRYFPGEGDSPQAMSQESLKGLGAQDLATIDQESRAEAQQSLAASGTSLTSWGGTSRIEVSGLWGLQREFVRPASDGVETLLVRIQRFPLRERTFSITTAIPASAQQVAGPICDEILLSLQVEQSRPMPTPSAEGPPPRAKPKSRRVYSVDELPSSFHPGIAIGIGLVVVGLGALRLGILAGRFHDRVWRKGAK
jgi:hypothetical protein